MSQEREFARLIRSEVSKYEAYRDSYNKTEDVSDKTCSNRASELLNKKGKEIQEYITELNDKEDNKRIEIGIWDENKSIDILKGLINKAINKIEAGGVNKDDANIVINSVKEINNNRSL